MDWAASNAKEPCTTVEEQHLDRAHAPWTYFWPHAQAVSGQAPSTIAERRCGGLVAGYGACGPRRYCAWTCAARRSATG
jgi:hypothetical protein